MADETQFTVGARVELIDAPGLDATIIRSGVDRGPGWRHSVQVCWSDDSTSWVDVQELKLMADDIHSALEAEHRQIAMRAGETTPDAQSLAQAAYDAGGRVVAIYPQGYLVVVWAEFRSRKDIELWQQYEIQSGVTKLVSKPIE